MDNSLKIKKIMVGKGAGAYSLTNDILNRLPATLPVLHVDSDDSESKRSVMEKGALYLLPYKGEFLKPCPGTKEYICCGYQILNLAANCPLDCSYCVLQDYFNQPDLRVFVNFENELDAVFKVIDNEPDKIFRIGTGEFTDSLALDPVTHWSKIIVPEFSIRKNVILELKTKTTHVGGVINLKQRDRIIISWSLNSSYIATREEHKAPSIKQRLQAAQRCQSEGFVLGFHFDPLIVHPGWKDNYLKTLDLLDKYIDPKGVIWISMGSMRFMPSLKSVIKKRHPGTGVLKGEFIVGLDGKSRYFKPIRIDLYSFMKENFEKWQPDLGLYLCMESDEVWRKSMGWSPENSKGLSSYLDSRVVDFFDDH
jgi:spore photoproduct lyase